MILTSVVAAALAVCSAVVFGPLTDLRHLDSPAEVGLALARAVPAPRRRRSPGEFMPKRRHYSPAVAASSMVMLDSATRKAPGSGRSGRKLSRGRCRPGRAGRADRCRSSDRRRPSPAVTIGPCPGRKVRQSRCIYSRDGLSRGSPVMAGSSPLLITVSGAAANGRLYIFRVIL